MLTAQEARELLIYDPATGNFWWRVAPKRGTAAGTPAGTIDGVGYRGIMYGGRRYRAHRLAWLYVHGRWPTDQIDHINGNRLDNRITNLREATHQQNCTNSRRKIGITGLKGVSYDQRRRKWFAQIRDKRVAHFLGRFGTAEEAHAAYVAAAKKLHGEFARFE